MWKTNQHDPLNTSSEASERQVSADVVVEAVVFVLVDARSADTGVIISAVGPLNAWKLGNFYVSRVNWR